MEVPRVTLRDSGSLYIPETYAEKRVTLRSSAWAGGVCGCSTWAGMAPSAIQLGLPDTEAILETSLSAFCF